MSELRDAAREAYEWLANQKTPPVEGPLSILIRYAPKVVTPIYLGARLGYRFGEAGAQGKFGSGPGVGLVRTEEIAEYERSALRTSRII
jgi:hypothetical protein